MKKSIIITALIAAASTMTYAQSSEIEGANRVILRTQSGETQVYKFSDLQSMEFDRVEDPVITLSLKEGSVSSSGATITANGEFDHFTVSYTNTATNDIVTLPDSFGKDAEVVLTGLESESSYLVMAIPYDKYDITGETATLEFTTPVEINLPAPKIGDYFYSDGTWSDGGLVSIDSDGRNAVWSATKPAPIEGKTVIGIVCVTDPERIAPEDVADGYTHGYVISTRNLTDPLKMNYSQHPETIWYGAYLSEGDETQVVKLAKSAYERVSGRQDTQTVLSKYPGTEEVDCPLFYRATTQLGEAPANTSGWFVPSTGQLWDCIANFCSGIVANVLKSDRTLTQDFTYYVSHTVNVNVMGEFMKVFELVPDSDKDAITVNDYTYPSKGIALRTSNRYETDSTIIFNLGTESPGLVEGMAAYRDEEGHARAFLAF